MNTSAHCNLYSLHLSFFQSLVCCAESNDNYSHASYYEIYPQTGTVSEETSFYSLQPELTCRRGHGWRYPHFCKDKGFFQCVRSYECCFPARAYVLRTLYDKSKGTHTHDKPAIRIFFFISVRDARLFFLAFLVPTLAIIFSVPSPDNSYIFLMFTWKYAAMWIRIVLLQIFIKHFIFNFHVCLFELLNS